MIGTILQNRYEIIEKIGEGGMAKVYKGKCNILNRYVTIKILKDNYYKDENFTKNFRKEATAVAGLSHNNIVKVYDIVEEQNIIYIVMEYIEGKDLKQIINERRSLDYEESLEIALQIAMALKHAHNNQIIHRDIKSHNILISNDGLVKVTDFGIAKVPSQDTITSSDKIIGSAQYISPEQAKGHIVDEQSDLYSLGIVLYEMITGKLPFNADSAVTLAIMHIQDEIVNPNDINESIPKSVNNLVAKLLQKEKYNRYCNADKVIDDIKNLISDINYRIDKVTCEQERTRVIPVFNEERILEENYNKDKKNNNSNKKRNLMIIGVIVAAVATFSLSYLAGTGKLTFDKTKKVEMVEIPSLSGMMEEDAEKLMSSYGLEMIPIEISSTEKMGSVIQCYPYEGSKIDKNSVDVIRVLISKGTSNTTVPELVNSNLEAAKFLLEENGLLLGDVEYINSDLYDKNIVISQEIKQGIQVDSNTSLDLVVSNGSSVKYVIMPVIVDQTYDKAIETLKDSNLKLGKVNEIETNDSTLENKVAIQSIPKNIEIAANTKIDVSYYIYTPSMVKVPDLVGKSVKEALNIVNEIGLSLNYQGENDYIIVSQTYSSETKVEKGTEIVVETEDTINNKTEEEPTLEEDIITEENTIDEGVVQEEN
ncbi:Stk1 family PASTA domain-containing Ser/Thr kinase [Clostridium sp. DL1XJH146]